jgi:hypothetical protein
MTPRLVPRDPLPGFGRLALIAGGLALAVSLVGLVVTPGAFLRAYLPAYLFWLGLSLGCLALSLLHYLAGGAWGLAVLRPAEAAARLLPLAAVFFLPIALGIRTIYPWTDQAWMAAQAHLAHKTAYLNIPFFLARSGAYFAVWLVLSLLAGRWSRQLDTDPDPRLGRRLRRLSGVGLLALGLTAVFAGIDWLMSLEPEWHSAIYGGMVAMGAALSAFAFVVFVSMALARRSVLRAVLSPQQLNDLGNLLLTFVVVWAYMAYSQFIIIWSGNLREEITWYVRRSQGGWEWLAAAVVVAGVAVPVLVLLSRQDKRSRGWLMLAAGLVLATRWVDTVWLTAPVFHATPAGLSWLDFVLPAALGGLWLAAYAWQLGPVPLLPMYDPRARQALAAQHAAERRWPAARRRA